MQLYQRTDLLRLQQAGHIPGTLQWMGADQLSTWQHNLRGNPYLQYQYPGIDYQLNSQGFRCAEWADCDWSESLVVLGCSVTLGEGLRHDQIWTEQLSSRLARPVINLGISGAGSALITANNLVLWHWGHRPKLVINVWPTADRVTAFTEQGVICMGAWQVTAADTAEELARWQRVYQQVNHSDYHQNSLLTQSSLTVRALWGSQSREYTWAPSSAEILGCDLLTWSQGDLARDQRHPGAETHRQWAAEIARDIGDLL